MATHYDNYGDVLITYGIVIDRCQFFNFQLILLTQLNSIKKLKVPHIEYKIEKDDISPLNMKVYQYLI